MQSVQVIASSPATIDRHRRRRRRQRSKQKQKQETLLDHDFLVAPLLVSDSNNSKDALGSDNKSPYPEKMHKLSEKLVTIYWKQPTSFSDKNGVSLSNEVLLDNSASTLEDISKTTMVPSISSSSSSSNTTATTSSITQDLFLLESETCQRIYPNELLHRIDNSDVSGYMLAMMSTNDHTVSHFHGRKRKVELQFQIKFKKVPQYPLFIGCELKGSTKISIWQKTLLKAIATSIERRNKDFLYNLDTSEELRREGKYETDDCDYSNFQLSRGPYMAMPFESSVNALVVTKKGDIPPILGEAIQQGEKSSKLDRLEINTSDTYTFALWTANVDLPQWKCTSKSTIQPFSLNTLIGGQPFSLSLYSMNPSNSAVKRYFELEISHKLSQSGPARKVWLLQKNGLHCSTTDSSLLDMVSDADLIPGSTVHYQEDRNDLDSSCQRSCVCWSDWE